MEFGVLVGKPYLFGMRTATKVYDILVKKQFESDESLTVLFKCSCCRLIRLLDPAFGAEKCMTVRTETAHLVRRRLITYDTYKDDTDEDTMQMLGGVHDEAMAPQAEEFVDRNPQKSLDLIRILLLGTW